MLLRIMQHDFIMNKKVLLGFLSGVIVYFLYVSYSVNSIQTFVILTAMVTTLFCFTLFTRESKCKTEATMCSLPINRRWLIIARYLSFLLYSTCGVILVIAIVALSPWSTIGIKQLVTFESIYLLFGVATVTQLLFFPLLMRFGAMGLIIAFAGLQLVGLILMVLASGFHLRLNVGIMVNVLESGLSNMAQMLGGIFFYIFLTLFFILLNLLTVFISVKIYQQKEL